MRKKAEPQTVEDVKKVIKARRKDYRLAQIEPILKSIGKNEITEAANAYRAKMLGQINRKGSQYHFPRMNDDERHFVAWVEEDCAFIAGVKWVLKRLANKK